MKFRPLHDHVVTRRVTAEEKTVGGIRGQVEATTSDYWPAGSRSFASVSRPRSR
jgi:hypothetical protein